MAGNVTRRSVRAIVVHDNHVLVMKRNKFGKHFYALVGGGIDPGEEPEAALLREVREEAELKVTDPRLVIVQDAGVFGEQYIYLCEYVAGTPALAADSEEAQDNAAGLNLYEPLWLPVDELAGIDLLPKELKPLIIAGLKHGFPDKPIHFSVVE
jgi:8-oxo-dGTP pyrophosphatase MutT (NUDIX family)